MSAVMITGGAGFIGQHLIDHLLESTKRRLVVVDTQRLAGLPTRVTSYESDICWTGSLEALIAKHKVSQIIHLAALPGVARCELEPHECIRNNVEGTVSVAEAARKSGHVKRVIFASSSTVYGAKGKEMREQDRPEPLSIYGESKLAGERLLSLYDQRGAFEAICLRLFSVIGPGLRSDLAPSIFLQKAVNGQPITRYGNGEQTRDWTHVGDTVRAFGLALKLPPGYFRKRLVNAINIGSGRPCKLNDLLLLITSQVRRALEMPRAAKIEEMPERSFDALRTFADRMLAWEVLRWEPERNWQDAAIEFVNDSLARLKHEQQTKAATQQ